jgi:hypothetical protein
MNWETLLDVLRGSNLDSELLKYGMDLYSLLQ